MTNLRSMHDNTEGLDPSLDLLDLNLDWSMEFQDESETVTETIIKRILYEDSQTAMRALCVIQRISGGLSLLGGLYIFSRAWQRKHCAFHRIMLGLSGHTMLYGIYHLWGTAAIPAGTPGISGAHGNTTTCSVQGFLFQVSMVVPFYYVFLSLYSWVVVLHSNFDPKYYEWVEKYIHVGVHIFPIASAIYLWVIESFNSNGLQCWIASLPSGCGGSSGIECTRGPQNPQTMLWIFGGMPAIFFLVFPTIVMITLTYCVYLKQTKTNNNARVVVQIMPASMIAKQSAIYIGSLYWVYLPLFLYYGVNYFSEQKSYFIAVWVNLITNSMGIWFAIVYWYFSTDDCNDENDETAPSSKTKAGRMTTIAEESSQHEKSIDLMMNVSSTNMTASTSRTSKRTSRASKRFSFNIFDGTKSSGYFSAFVFDGDSDDEAKDAAESKLWEDCQQMNNDD